MERYTVAVIVGSLRRESLNRKLANALVKLGPAEFTFEDVSIRDLPLYNQDDDKQQAPAVLHMKERIRAAQGVLFATPEYNRGMPGVLKNAIDHGSRPYGQSCWLGKPAGIVGASLGTVGTAIAQQQLRTTLAALDVLTLGLPEVFIHAKEGFFDAAGEIASEGTRKFLAGWMDRYVAWVKKHA